MLTLFSTPKKFNGHFGIIQENAIRSWKQLKGDIQIILIGNDEGVAQFAQKEGLLHIPLQNQSQEGAPSLDQVFNVASSAALYDNLCFVNADIILFQDFINACQKVFKSFDKYLIISSRFNMDIVRDVEVEKPEVLKKLRAAAKLKNDMYPAGGSDFFAFPKNFFQQIPPFIIGRGYWDNWLMYQAGKQGAKIVDVTPDVVALHQNHDYRHIPGILDAQVTADKVFVSQEGKENLKLAGGHRKLYTNYDANYVLCKGKLRRTIYPPLLYRRVKAGVRRLFK